MDDDGVGAIEFELLLEFELPERVVVVVVALQPARLCCHLLTLLAARLFVGAPLQALGCPVNYYFVAVFVVVGAHPPVRHILDCLGNSVTTFLTLPLLPLVLFHSLHKGTGIGCRNAVWHPSSILNIRRKSVRHCLFGEALLE